MAILTHRRVAIGVGLWRRRRKKRRTLLFHTDPAIVFQISKLPFPCTRKHLATLIPMG